MKGELPGEGADGKLSVQEAEAIEGYVKRLGRLRWKCTGSREPLIKSSRPILKSDEKPNLPVEQVVTVMEDLIPSLTNEMVQIVNQIRSKNKKKTHLSKAEEHDLITKEWVLTE